MLNPTVHCRAILFPVVALIAAIPAQAQSYDVSRVELLRLSEKDPGVD
jgi:hypothetical protein